MDSVDTSRGSIGMTSTNPVLMKAKSKKEYVGVIHINYKSL